MAASSAVGSQQSSSLQQQAIEKARSSFSHLPKEDAIFQQCINRADSIPDVIKSVIRTSRSYKRRKSTRLLRKFEQHTQFLQNASDIIDVVVQTQAGIGCPLWAPIKFVSKDNAQAAEQILNLIEVISESHPRFEIYGKLPPDPILQIALLNIFTDVVEFSVRAYRFFSRSAPVRMARLVVRPLKEEFGDIFERLKRRTEVVDLTAMATQLLRAAESRQDAQKFRCQSWLEPPNVRDFHQLQLHAKLTGTCGWIKGDPAFMEWNGPSSLSVSGRLLCISGTHGCGKTILASSIIEDLKSTQRQTIYFYFSGMKETLKSLNGIVRSFLWQLVEETTDQRSLELITGLVLKGPPALVDIVHVLKQIVAVVTRPVYFVIDGVDEYIDECHDSIENLLQLVLGLLNANASVRVVLLGRQHVLQPHVLQATIGATPERIEISSNLVRQDISAFVGAEIDAKINSDLLRLPGLRDSISKTLQEKSDGMFLWVELMIKDLRKSDSQFEVEERLRNPPRGIEGVYRHLFLRLVKRLDKVQLDLARKILAFTIVSCRTLEVNELQYAQTLESGSLAFKERLLLHPTKSFLDVCGDFINIKDDLVQLIHFSVQEFLTRPEDEWQHSDDQEIMCFRVVLEPLHRSLGSACVDYVGMCEYGYPLSDTDAFLKLAKDYPFIRYASRYAISHLNQGGPFSSTTVRKIRDFLGSENSPPWIEYLAMLVLDDGSLATLGDEFEKFLSRLIAVQQVEGKQFGIDVQMLLKQELERRMLMFGQHDSRTEQWQSFLHIIENKSPNGNVAEGANRKLTSQTPRLPLTDESSLSHISNTLIHNPTLPLHRQIDILLRLKSHLQRVKVLTDPLKMLFRLLLQKSHAIPVYVLWAVADFYRKLEKWEEALEVYRVAFAKIEAQEAPFKFAILFNVGYVLQQQGKHKEAEATFRRCLEGRERVLGKEHEKTMKIAYWLAVTLEHQGNYQEAENTHRQTLATRERILGKEHEDTLWSACGLGDVLRQLGKYQEAEVIYRRVLVARTSGKDHSRVLWTTYGLARSLTSLGKDEEAEAICRRRLEGKQNLLGGIARIKWVG
ncbi:uncharacterized protein PAC_12857 [Phialocephala subalpina]|uniref:Uncharacterized protein n=1 Tax=Phialocephala subalpina TaxID=576137 RepID=A0A1L7XD41_9HELO|nr:uncharacterized protein PAC_12857 [Phialocephala subalpina]